MRIFGYLGLLGCAVLAATIAYSVWTGGIEFSSWVSGSIGALLALSSTVAKLLQIVMGDKGKDGDAVKQRSIKAKGDVIAKRGQSESPSIDKISQRDIESTEGSVIGKDELPPK